MIPNVHFIHSEISFSSLAHALAAGAHKGLSKYVAHRTPQMIRVLYPKVFFCSCHSWGLILQDGAGTHHHLTFGSDKAAPVTFHSLQEVQKGRHFLKKKLF